MTQPAQQPEESSAPTAAVDRRRRQPPSAGPVHWFVNVVAPRLVHIAVRLLSKTLRTEYVGADDLFGRWQRGEQVIVSFWHNRLLLMPTAYRGRQLCVLNSGHRDGDLATRALVGWRIRAVRGSATRGGVSGFLQLVRAYRDGDDLAVVPDGPRGPRYEVKPGIIHLARSTGAPIFPVTFAASRLHQLHSWDRLVIPAPFARVVFVIGAPLHVARHASEEEAERARAELQARLNGITAEAEKRAGRRAA
jgi:lysophospholipid acyltransferase (LPLAT)-like uncharacterized protein